MSHLQLDVHKFESMDSLGTAMMHTMYTLLIPILLFNLLIAIFSNSYTDVWQHRNLLMTIQRIALVFTIEKRLSFAPSLYRYLGCWAFRRTGQRFLITVFQLASSDTIHADIRQMEYSCEQSCREPRHFGGFKHTDGPKQTAYNLQQIHEKQMASGFREMSGKHPDGVRADLEMKDLDQMNVKKNDGRSSRPQYNFTTVKL